MTTKLAVFDMNGVLTDEYLAVRLTKYKPDTTTYFRLFKQGKIGERELVIESSRLFKGLSYEVINQEAQFIEPRINDLNLPGWEIAIVSMDYFELVERIAKMLGISRYYGNRIIYENNLHSGRVEEPIIDSEQKKAIVSRLKAELKPKIIVGIDDKEDSPFKDVCGRVFHVSTKKELEKIFEKFRQL
jgi:phosphoserine phosphatase